MQRVERLVVAVIAVAGFVMSTHAQQLNPAAGPRLGDIRILRVELTDADSLRRLTRDGYDIDDVSPDYATVYATPEEKARLTGQGYSVTEIGREPATPPIISGEKTFGVYHSYQSLTEALESFAEDFPNIARLTSLGQSYEGKELWAMLITDNPDVEEDEPEFKYVSTMHGDEVVGVELCLYLIDKILHDYGTDSRITDLVDSTAIWIVPLMNPDSHLVRRANAQGLNLNRSFPVFGSDFTTTFFDGDALGAQGRPPEAAHVMNWTVENSFVLAANFHEGALVVNYPYDQAPGIYSGQDAPSPDDLLFEDLSLRYAVHNVPMSNSTEFPDGITNGAFWYSISGGMQDWNYRYAGCMAVTIEVSQAKTPLESTLPGFWADNEESMLAYIEAVHIGLRGIVSDAVSGDPLWAKVLVEGNSQPVFTDPDVGDYHRLLLPGTYSLRFMAEGYNLAAVDDVVAGSGDATRVDVALHPATLFVDSITRADTSPTNNTSVDFIVTFSEAVTGVNTVPNSADFDLSIGGASITSISGEGRVYTVTVSTGTRDGTLRLDVVDDDSIQDAAGNPLGGYGLGNGDFTLGEAYVIDLTPPTLLIDAPDPAITNTGPATFALTYGGADAVSLVPGLVTLNRGGTATASVSVSGGDTVAPTVTLSDISGDGSLRISIAQGSASDVMGNAALATGPSDALIVDNTAPSLALGKPSRYNTSAGPVSFAIAYSGADSVELAAEDLIMNASGTVTGLLTVSGSGTEARTATVASITGDGLLSLSVAAGTARDEAGNLASGAGPSREVEIDNIPPALTISLPSTQLTSTGPVTYSVAYTGATRISLSEDDVGLNVEGGVSGAVSVVGTGSQTRTVVVSAISGNGTAGISIAAGSASDTAGNQAPTAGPSPSFAVENAALTVSIGPPSLFLTDTGPVAYEVVFGNASEITLNPLDITLHATGTAEAVVTVSGSGQEQRTVTLSDITGTGHLSFFIAAGTAWSEGGQLAPSSGPSATVQILHAPDAPATVSASDGEFAEAVHVAWDAVPGATAYQVYRAPTDAAPEPVAISLWLELLWFEDETAEPDRIYAYWVVARNDLASSEFGGPATGFRHTASPPLAVFTASPLGGTAPVEVVFTDTSAAGSAPITAWLWDFGDPESGAENTSTEPHPTHVYTTPGTYTVTLTVLAGAETDLAVREGLIEVQAPDPLNIDFDCTSGVAAGAFIGHDPQVPPGGLAFLGIVLITLFSTRRGSTRWINSIRRSS